MDNWACQQGRRVFAEREISKDKLLVCTKASSNTLIFLSSHCRLESTVTGLLQFRKSYLTRVSESFPTLDCCGVEDSGFIVASPFLWLATLALKDTWAETLRLQLLSNFCHVRKRPFQAQQIINPLLWSYQRSNYNCRGRQANWSSVWVVCRLQAWLHVSHHKQWYGYVWDTETARPGPYDIIMPPRALRDRQIQWLI